MGNDLMNNPRLICALLLFATYMAPRYALAEDPRLPILNIMKDELQRNKEKLSSLGSAPVYFIGYRFNCRDEVELEAKLGALSQQTDERKTAAYVQVRVGDYVLDNTPINSTGIGTYAKEWAYGPMEPDADAIRACFWLTTDKAYKRALAEISSKQSELQKRVAQTDRLADFTTETAVKYIAPAVKRELDASKWAAIVKTASARFKESPWIHDSDVSISGERNTEYVVNTEGTEVVTDAVIYDFSISCLAWSKEGTLEGHAYRLLTPDPAELPDAAKAVALVDQVTSEIRQILDAEVQFPYNGPAILWPEAAGVFFHEAVGHRLEADRLRVEQDGHTFKDKIGQQILPDFINVWDDPTVKTFNGKALVGSYDYDQDGVAGQRVQLVEKGILRNYLMGRRPIDKFTHSNGHGRAAPFRQAMARMGNLFISSTKTVPYDKLKQMLLEECRKRGKDYGIIIRSMYSGETNTSTWEPQSFEVEPRLAYRVDAKTGEEKLIRGIELVGTPLTALQNILACSETSGTLNAYCGAISGSVGNSEIAPALLVGEIELQKANPTMGRPPFVAAPYGLTKK